MEKQYDAIVVGGGPIGGYISSKISSAGYKIAIFEQHKKIGEPLNCAGLATSRIFNISGIKKENIIQNEIKGANIHSPSGKILTIGGDKVQALVIDRSRFDQEIIKKSIKNGSDLFLRNKILSAQRTKRHIELKTSNKEDIKCNLLIGADGPYSKIRDIFGFTKPKEYLKGMGAEIENTKLNPEFVEIFIGNNIAPGFFAWIIPSNYEGTKARIGLCIKEKTSYSLIHYFQNFFKNKYISPYLKNIKIIRKTGGIIPLGYIKKPYTNNILLAGDAAAQVKPTSGGGIYSGLLCADYCSIVAIEALNKNNFSSNLLKKYSKLISSDIGREFYIGMKFRKVYNDLDDIKLNSQIDLLNKEKIIKIISKYGDIDYPSKLIPHLIKNAPSLLKFIPKIIK